MVARLPTSAASPRTAVTSIRIRTARLLLLFGVVPLLLLGSVLAVGYTQAARERLEVSLRNARNATDQTVAGFVGPALQAVTLAAQAPELAARFQPDPLQAWLDALRRTNPDLVALTAYDAGGAPVAGDGSGGPTSGSDRPVRDATGQACFREVARTGRPCVSGLSAARALGPGPAVTVAAPVLNAQGRLTGVIEAALDPADLDIRLDKLLVAPRMALVLDGDGRVVYASAGLGIARGVIVGDLPSLEPLRAAAEGQPVDLVALTGGAERLIGMRARNVAGWTVCALLPRSLLVDALVQGASIAMLVLLLVLCAAVYAVPRAVAAVAQPIAELAQAIAGFDPASVPADPIVPADLPVELMPIAASVRTLAARLRESFTRLEDVLDDQRALRQQLDDTLREREHEIERRTGELRTALATLRDETLTDGLTGLGNYRAYRERLEQIWRSAQAGGDVVGAILLDVDHFKRFNDRYGHLAGDQCLRRVALAFAGTVGPRAMLAARNGGEEFIALFRGVGRRDLRELAEAARHAVQRLMLDNADTEIGLVTVSLGVAAVVPETGIAPDALVRAADLALYRAKRGGRNRVIEFSPAALQELRRRREVMA